MPRFPVPAGETEESWFVKEVEAGCSCGTRAAVPDDVREQADYEIGVILQMGFPGYFLVVADFIKWAKEQGIRVGPGRGSAAGSHGRVRDGHHRPRPARSTAWCSSGSSTPSASRCPTSTSTSTSVAAAT